MVKEAMKASLKKKNSSRETQEEEKKDDLYNLDGLSINNSWFESNWASAVSFCKAVNKKGSLTNKSELFVLSQIRKPLKKKKVLF